MRHGGLTSDPSASKVEAFVQCPASHCFPQAPETTARATAGTEKHAPLTASINGTGPKDPLATMLTDGVLELVAEPAYVVNVKNRTSRLVGIDIGRSYGELGPYDVPVSLDVQGRRSDGTLWLRDWKFGTYSSRWQLTIQAMALLFKPNPGSPVVDAGFSFIDDGAHTHTDAFLIGRMDLEDQADEVVRAFDKVRDIAGIIWAKGTPELKQGPWCQYCPARDLCPAKWGMIRAALGELATMNELVGAMTVEKCGQAWAWVKEVERFAEKARETLKMRLEDGATFPLPNGKELALTRKKGWSYPQKDKTLKLLEKLGATKAQVDSVMTTRSDTVSTVERNPK